MNGPIDDFLARLHAALLPLTDGAPASYIPELAKVDPALFGIAIATVDGAVHAVGDADHRFTIQSISKAFVYGHALEEHGRDAVLTQVGVEPSGDSFNSMALDMANRRPFNPMVNSGAIATAELIAGADEKERRATLHALFARFAGRALDIDEAVYLSEKETGHRNRAIAWMMLSAGMLKDDPEAVLDLYFRQCSLSLSARDLALMGATLANDGVHPITGECALSADYVPDVLTVMNSCGMYNYAGQWAWEVGLPAKSGVSGAILAVIPGQAGIAIYSPPVDERGNSVRAIEACRRIAESFGLHLFRTHPDPRGAIRNVLDGRQVRSKRTRSLAELDVLARHGAAIRVMEAQAALYFGSVERLLRRAAELAEEADFVIIDMRRVTSADASSLRLLARFRETMRDAGETILFAHVTEHGPLALLHARLEDDSLYSTRDLALEACEDRLIARHLGDHAPPAQRFEAFELFRGLDADQIGLLRDIAEPLLADRGDLIARSGEPADRFFVLERGSASICQRLEDGGILRLTAIGPGVGFGERALIDGGPRTADVIADESVLVHAFPVDQVRALGAMYPAILVTLLSNMAGELSERLQLANAELRAMQG